MRDFTAKFEKDLSNMRYTVFNKPALIEEVIAVCPTKGFCQAEYNFKTKGVYNEANRRTPSVGLRYAINCDDYSGYYRVASYVICTNSNCRNAINEADASWINNFLERVGPKKISFDEATSPEVNELFGF